MTDTQKKNINAEEIGYMSYNKLNVFMTILLLGFSITFAILGDRVNISNPFTSMGDWNWKTIGIVILFIVGIVSAGIPIFKLGLEIINNPIIIAAIISIISIGGIGHLLLPEYGAYILDGILAVFLLAGFIPRFSSIYRMLPESRPASFKMEESSSQANKSFTAPSSILFHLKNIFNLKNISNLINSLSNKPSASSSLAASSAEAASSSSTSSMIRAFKISVSLTVSLIILIISVAAILGLPAPSS